MQTTPRGSAPDPADADALPGQASDRQAPQYRKRRWLLAGAFAVWGPGIIVMLADGDAGCLITAAQSGAQWGYRLILPQLLLIPVLYLVQEMTVRLGILTGRGHGALIKEQFGRGWAVLSVSPIIVSAVGTLVVEFVGVAGVGELFGVSRWITVPVAAACLIALAFGHGYRRVERIGIAIGLAELAFVPAMLLAHPRLSQVTGQLGSQPLGQSSYLTLLAATVGAVIMPWMIFYQQGVRGRDDLRPLHDHPNPGTLMRRPCRGAQGSRGSGMAEFGAEQAQVVIAKAVGGQPPGGPAVAGVHLLQERCHRFWPRPVRLDGLPVDVARVRG